MEISTLEFKTRDIKTIDEFKSNMLNNVKWPLVIGPLFIGECVVSNIKSITEDSQGKLYVFVILVVNN